MATVSEGFARAATATRVSPHLLEKIERRVSPVSTSNPVPVSAPTAPAAKADMVTAWIRLLRPKQWVKNAFVLMPLLFSGKARDLRSEAYSLLACAAFCLISSAVYAFNDAFDRDRDRAHPTKRT